MKFFESLKIAVDSIKSNKLRSFLTMLGIIIGISSVIAIISLGQGGQGAVTDQFEKIGANTVTISLDNTKAQKSDYFTFQDVKQIKNKINSVKYISPVVLKSGIVASNMKTKNANITGSNVDYVDIENYGILYGRYFNEMEENEAKAVAVIDENTAKELFGYANVVGTSINLGPQNSSRKVKIVGVKSSANVFGGRANMPARIDTPITFLKTMYSGDFAINSLYLSAGSKEVSKDAGDSTISLLESRHNNRGKEIYTAENVFKQLDQINKVLGIFTEFIGAVAAISLIVGGIGVMNIMLVSVTERTREIGIRKAIGATTSNIMLQFLTESVIISLIGGIIGMALGILGAEVIGYAFNIIPVISPSVIISSIVFSSAVGIFFGIYPAKKAAALNPIDALRYE